MKGKNGKYYKHLVWKGKVTTVECKEHTYRLTGEMPCTGIKACVFCNKPEEEGR